MKERRGGRDSKLEGVQGSLSSDLKVIKSSSKVSKKIVNFTPLVMHVGKILM